MDKPQTILVVVVRPGEAAAPTRIPSTLAALQELVGGDIESLHVAELRAERLHAYCHMDGKRLDMSPCLAIPGDVVRGPIVVSAADESGDELGLTHAEAARVCALMDHARTAQGLLPVVLCPTCRLDDGMMTRELALSFGIALGVAMVATYGPGAREHLESVMCPEHLALVRAASRALAGIVDPPPPPSN